MNIFVPQTEHTPWFAFFPFFMVTSFTSFISLFALHFMQYASIISPNIYYLSVLNIFRKGLPRIEYLNTGDAKVNMAGKSGRGAARDAFYLAAGFAMGIAVAFIFFGFASAPPAALNLTQSYESAVRDSAFAQASDICNSLTAIVPSNQNLTWNGTGGGRRFWSSR